MTAKHTPAPWFIFNNGASISIHSKKFDVCRLDDYIISSDEVVEQNNANAKLIAAAPDLLEICLELQESAFYWSDYDVPLGIVERLNAVIAKATGVEHDADE